MTECAKGFRLKSPLQSEGACSQDEVKAHASIIDHFKGFEFYPERNRKPLKDFRW